MLRWIIALTVACCAFGQQLTPSLIEFLDLTAAQITRLRQSAAEFNKLHGEKSQRYQQVSRELDEETAREVLDPLGLGQRYVEQEAICRELRGAYQQNFDRNLTILTEAQKAKLKTLDTVSTNASLASAAASENLIDYAGGFGGFGLVSRGLISFSPIFDPYSSLSTIPSSICGIPTVQANPVLSRGQKESK